MRDGRLEDRKSWQKWSPGVLFHPPLLSPIAFFSSLSEGRWERWLRLRGKHEGSLFLLEWCPLFVFMTGLKICALLCLDAYFFSYLSLVIYICLMWDESKRRFQNSAHKRLFPPDFLSPVFFSSDFHGAGFVCVSTILMGISFLKQTFTKVDFWPTPNTNTLTISDLSLRYKEIWLDLKHILSCSLLALSLGLKK